MTKQKDEASSSSGKGGKLRSVGLAAAFAVVGALVGPKLLGSSGSDAAAATADTTTTTVEGPMVVLDAVTLNLADGHLLQVGLALELSHEAGSGGGHGEEVDEDDPTKGYARALDAAIRVFSGHSMTSLSAPGGRDEAKAGLEQELEALYHGEITGVYFHQFVMQ